jgi:hypothetical protein
MYQAIERYWNKKWMLDYLVKPLQIARVAFSTAGDIQSRPGYKKHIINEKKVQTTQT